LLHSLHEDDAHLVQPKIGDKAISTPSKATWRGLTKLAAKSFSSALFIPPVAARATLPNLVVLPLQMYLGSVDQVRFFRGRSM
jgi:hypothetical protein